MVGAVSPPFLPGRKSPFHTYSADGGGPVTAGIKLTECSGGTLRAFADAALSPWPTAHVSNPSDSLICSTAPHIHGKSSSRIHNWLSAVPSIKVRTGPT